MNEHAPAERFVEQLTEIVGADGVRSGAAVAALDPGFEPRNLAAGLMARPRDAAQAARVLALCSMHGVGVVTHGGRTGLSGGARTRPGELILALDRMTAIEDIDALGRTATVQAGVTLAQLDAAAAPYGLTAGIDLGARDSATIGGMVATNAGGIDAFRLGTMRERVLGLEVALASGAVLEQLSRVRKDNAGLAVRQLFIGSEGALGVITRVVIALVPTAGVRHAAFAVVADIDSAVRVMRAVETRPRATLVAAELMSGNHIAVTAQALGVSQLSQTPASAFGLLIAVAGGDGEVARDELEQALCAAAGEGLLLDCVLPKNAAEERDLCRVREDWAVDRTYPGGLWYDVSVPIDRLHGYLVGLTARIRKHDPALSIYVVGHLGDGNVHVTVNAPHPLAGRYDEIAPIVYAGLREFGGSFSAEHGIGVEKLHSLEQWAGPTGIALMRAIKDLFDPHGILNPGKVLSRGAA